MLLSYLRHVAVLAASLTAFGALAADPKPAPEAAGKKPAVLARGEKLKGLPLVKLAELVAAPDKYTGKAVRLEGTVRKTCTNKGCWMELAESAAPSAVGLRVVMKGHAFFVPTDSAGSRATVEGAVSAGTAGCEEGKHSESADDHAAKDKEGKAREVQFEANGVELTRT